MSTVKPDIDPEQVLSLLEEHFGKPASQFTPITAGLIARTFSFRVEDQDYIIRFQGGHIPIHYEKEKYIYEHYASPRIPIPPIVHLGSLHDVPFAISPKLPGQAHDRLSPQEYRQALPSVVETLFAIHQVNVRDRPGYGVFDGAGTGLWTSWQGFLSIIRDEEPEWDFYGKWHTLFENSFLERDLFDRIYDRMVRLLDYCPEDRYLVHGGYGFGNLLIHEGKVSGVLDWIDAKYGDFVYDIAWLDFWMRRNQGQQLYAEYAAGHGMSIPDLPERLLCYKCYIALDGLRFNAKVGNTNAYQWVRDHILNLMS